MLNPRVLLVSNDKKSKNELSKSLLDKQYEVLECQDLKHLSKMLDKKTFDLIIIDLDEDCSNEWTITLNIRKVTEKPIIFISNDIEECQKLLGYQLVNDFVKKPYSIEEVLCRLQVQLNTSKNIFCMEQIVLENLVVDTSIRKVLIDNREIDLTEKEFEVLKFLASNSDRVITREELVQQVWKEKYKGNPRTIDTHIKKLRKKIEKNSAKAYITTVWGYGYRMIV
ncbi:MAG: response regulator transcription factor [Bacillota bacterium]